MSKLKRAAIDKYLLKERQALIRSLQQKDYFAGRLDDRYLTPVNVNLLVEKVRYLIDKPQNYLPAYLLDVYEIYFQTLEAMRRVEAALPTARLLSIHADKFRDKRK